MPTVEHLTLSMREALTKIRFAIKDLAPNKRSCKFLGWNCVADFDISDATVMPFAFEILDKLGPAVDAYDAKQCHEIDIGLYDGGKDIRVWKVCIT
jgi:hypothetical protein